MIACEFPNTLRGFKMQQDVNKVGTINRKFLDSQAVATTGVSKIHATRKVLGSQKYVYMIYLQQLEESSLTVNELNLGHRR